MNKLDKISAISFSIAVLNHYASLFINDILLEVACAFYFVSAIAFIIPLICTKKVV